MNRFTILVALTLIGLPAMAAVKDCEELKGGIDAKLQAKGVSRYLLQILPVNAELPAAATIVGHCQGGQQQIIYTREEPSSTPSP